MNNQVLRHFATTVADYDTVAEAVVQKSKEMHHVMMQAVSSFESNSNLRFIDLGCGTGYGMALLLQKFPNAHVVGIDFSARMIAKCHQNLAEYRGCYELYEGDFTQVDFAGAYDAVVSAVAIHNISHEAKCTLFNKIFKCLKPQGVFINADFIAGESRFIDDQLKNLYRSYVQSNLKGEELDVWMRHIDFDDMPMSLSEQFEIFSKLGFAPAQLLWLFANQAVYMVAKP